MSCAETRQNVLYAVIGGEEVSVPIQDGETVLSALRRLSGVPVHAPCGGVGRCGKCTVFLLTPEGEREVLSCRTPARAGMRLRIPAPDTGVVVEEGNTAAVCAHQASEGYGIACDIGTTTVVCQLVELTSGAVLGAVGEGSAQSPYGADVITRIRAYSDGFGDELTRAIRGQLREMIVHLCRKWGLESAQIKRMTVAANPTMCHLLAGLSPEGIGAVPFVVRSYFGEAYAAEQLGLPFAGPVCILPCVSAYIGGDVTAGMLYAGLDGKKAPTLLLDVGTNGELVLSTGERLLCCSCAAGPAFEGAEIRFGMTAAEGAVSGVSLAGDQVVCSVIGGGAAKGICGSGLIDAVAVMLKLGALEPSGRMLDVEEDDDIPAAALPYLTLVDEEPAFRLTDTVFVTQRDVRKVQLGKAAVAAGIRVLLEEAGLKAGQVGEVLLAGGFGSYIRPESAAGIGLIPEQLLSVTRAAGNTAVMGARMALVNAEDRARLERLRGRAQYMELSGLSAFNTAYVEEMLFPGEEE